MSDDMTVDKMVLGLKSMGVKSAEDFTPEQDRRTPPQIELNYESGTMVSLVVNDVHVWRFDRPSQAKLAKHNLERALTQNPQNMGS